MILSVLSSPALVSGLMVARAKNPVHSVLFPIPVFRDTSGLYTFLFYQPLFQNVPIKFRPLFFRIAIIVLSIVLSKVAVALGYVFMEDLHRAVAQFYPSSSGGMSGGFHQPPAPEGSSAVPVFHIEETLDQPGPSASEGEGRAVRDYSKELQNIEELRKDKYLDGSYRNALISQENIIIEMKKSILSGNNISDDDIRKGVDIYLTGIMGMYNILYRNRKLSRILRDLTDRGSASTHFNAIVKDIESLNDPFF
jgi:hypothetical protein